MGDEISWIFEARVKPGRRAEGLRLVEPTRTTVWGKPSEALRAELGAGTRLHTALGRFIR